MKSLRLLCNALALVAFGCSTVGCSDVGPSPVEHTAKTSTRIINGQLDTTHQAVVAVFSEGGGGCSGTIIAHAGTEFIVLTAAHCFATSGAPQAVVMGDDYQSGQQFFSVFGYQIHPNYSETNNVYDFALVHMFGLSDMPVIPALTPAEDTLAVGTQVDHVGYGLISYPNGQTSVRHHAVGTLAEVSSFQIGYNQPSSGPCSGDSGGPELTMGTERVAGVVSFGDQECASFGVSGRVSSVYNGFIAPYIAAELPDSGATSSSSAASSGAGGSPATSSAGVGAGDPGVDYVAGDLEDQDIDGEVLTSSCSAGGRTSSGIAAALAVAAAALLAGRRRRS